VGRLKLCLLVRFTPAAIAAGKRGATEDDLCWLNVETIYSKHPLGLRGAPALVIERMAGEVLLLDRQGDPATELAIAGLIDSGEVNRHARKSLQIYAHGRSTVLGGHAVRRCWREHSIPDGRGRLRGRQSVSAMCDPCARPLDRHQ
jgi:hypothetical protein